MILFISNRILMSIPVVLGAISLTFIFMYIIPGDPVRSMVGDYYNDSDLEQLRDELGLNDSMAIQYVKFIKKNFKYVGDNFAYEARSIHYENNKDKIKGIYGKASIKEVNDLRDEGINTETIPWIDEKNN